MSEINNRKNILLHIYIDADACPVKDEVYKVAKRNDLSVTLVSNSWMRIPNYSWLTLNVVSDDPDAADDWIAENVQQNDIVITADIPLADRSLKKGAYVLGSTGKPFTEDNIGSALATRDLMSELRSSGVMTGGPPPMQKKDRSLFLQELDKIVQKIKREIE